MVIGDHGDANDASRRESPAGPTASVRLMSAPQQSTEPSAPTGRAGPAWSTDALSANPHGDPDKAARVQQMFAAIAARYDLNNRLHSFGLDQHWRRRAVRAVAPVTGARVLDVACGTGDLSLAFAAEGAGEVIGVDFTEPMLDIARAKAERARMKSRAARPEALSSMAGEAARSSTGPANAGTAGLHLPHFRFGDATALNFPDAGFDRVSIAFGLRNVSNPAKALREFRRVLRPDGRLVILEFDEPRMPIVRQLSRFYTRVIMPWSATLIARDRSGAYRYLPRSVETFLDRDALARLLRECGFEAIEQEALCAGVAVVTTARPTAAGAPGSDV